MRDHAGSLFFLGSSFLTLNFKENIAFVCRKGGAQANQDRTLIIYYYPWVNDH